jgi:parvulin-like peptidyl-prolyl isomerase
VGAKSGQKKKPAAGKTGRAAGFKRLALIVFGAIFVLLVIGFAIAQGIGQPSVPSGDVAVVKGVPDEISNVSETELKASIARLVVSSKLKKVPAPGSKKAEELKEAGLGELLEAIWIQGEAEELDLEVTDKEVETELAQIKKSNWPTTAAYQEFLKTSKLTQAEVDRLVRLQVFRTKIQEVVTAEAPTPSSSEIAEFYDQNRAQFTVKPSRDVRLIFSEDKGEAEEALKALKADDSPANWKVVAKKYSADPSTSSKGGLQEGLTEEALQGTGALQTAIFKAATGEVIGLTKFQSSYVIFEVEKLNPQKVQTLPEVKAQITTQLAEQTQQTFFTEFASQFQSKWVARTTCASSFLISRCNNYKGSGHPAEAPASCYEANPKTAPTECPAPVTQTKPAVPGSVTVLKPTGEQLVQRPQPEATAESAKEAAAKKLESAAEGASEAAGE